MPVTRLNHAVLYVRDAEQSAAFYEEVLGFRRLTMVSIRGAVGLYHLAWEVDTLDELERLAGLLSDRGALVGASDHGSTKALYAKDPDGIEFEVSWLVPADLIDDQALAAKTSIRPLDIAAEKQRYGASTRGGIGVSTPAPA